MGFYLNQFIGELDYTIDFIETHVLKHKTKQHTSDEEILNTTFNGHIIVRNDVHLMHNNIVYAGSEITKTLSEFYDDLSYLRINDFAVERNLKRH